MVNEPLEKLTGCRCGLTLLLLVAWVILARLGYDTVGSTVGDALLVVFITSLVLGGVLHYRPESVSQVARRTDPAVLGRIARKSKRGDMRKAAVERLTEIVKTQKTAKRQDMRGHMETKRTVQEVLKEVAKTDENSSVRKLFSD